ncbi:MAG: hypothetical protein ACTIOK_13705 [Enterococcus malodoratus]
MFSKEWVSKTVDLKRENRKKWISTFFDPDKKTHFSMSRKGFEGSDLFFLFDISPFIVPVPLFFEPNADVFRESVII